MTFKNGFILIGISIRPTGVLRCLKKLQKSVTIWEHLPKRYYFWTIIKQKTKKVWQFGVWQFEVMEKILFNSVLYWS